MISSAPGAVDTIPQEEGEIRHEDAAGHKDVVIASLVEEHGAEDFQGDNQHMARRNISTTSSLANGAMSSFALPPFVTSGRGIPAEQDATSEMGDNIHTEADIPEREESDNPPDIGEVRQPSAGPVMVTAEVDSLSKEVEPPVTILAQHDPHHIEKIVASEDVPPNHGVSWPTELQPPSLPGAEIFLGVLGNAVRFIIQGEVMPNIDDVRALLRENTNTYFRMGHSEGSWMESVDCIWKEFLDRRAEIAWQANCLKIQSLQSLISAKEEELSGLHLEAESIQKQKDVLIVEETTHQLQLKVIQDNIEDLLKSANMLKASLETNAQNVQQANVNAAQIAAKLQILEQEILFARAEVVVLEKQKPRHI